MLSCLSKMKPEGLDVQYPEQCVQRHLQVKSHQQKGTQENSQFMRLEPIGINHGVCQGLKHLSRLRKSAPRHPGGFRAELHHSSVVKKDEIPSIALLEVSL